MSSRAEALAPNLWRWTTPHPLWRPGDDDAWVRALERLDPVLVLPTHGRPAPDGPAVIRDALARPPWRFDGSG